MGNFFTLFEYDENIENIENDDNIANADDLTIENTQSLLIDRENTQDVNGCNLKNQITQEHNCFPENTDDTIYTISEHMSKQILKDIFKEIKRRNPIIDEENEDNQDSYHEINRFKTKLNSNHLESIVSLGINDNSTCVNPDVSSYILPIVDNFNKEKTYTYKQSYHYKMNKLPIFYPTITAIPYKFPPKPAPKHFIKPSVFKKKSKFSFWGNAYMDTKRLLQKPKLIYTPSNLNNNYKF